MATTPTFASTPKIGLNQTAAAQTARDTFAVAGGDLVLTAGANGTRVDRVDIISAALVGGGAPSANVARLWIYDGASVRLLVEVEVPSTTPTASVKGFTSAVNFPNGLILPAGYSLRATIHTYAGAPDKMNFIAHAADY